MGQHHKRCRIKMINNNVEPKHLGSGIVLFENAIDIDFNYAVEMSRSTVAKERSAMYTPAIDPETGKEVYLNKSGYFFSKDSIDNMPGRGSAIHQDTTPEVIELLSFLEKTKDNYLFKYFELFPLAFKCVWWKVKSHIVSYEKDVYLGSHSDVSADYVYDIWTPTDQLATRNVISNIVYFNDSVDTVDDLDGMNFIGGHHYFNYLDIEYKPKKGDILFFPSNFMAAHEVKRVNYGSRFSYLGWYSHGTPNKEVGESVVDPLKEVDQSRFATNIYMPTLVEDYRNHLLARGFSESSDQYYLTKSHH